MNLKTAYKNFIIISKMAVVLAVFGSCKNEFLNPEKENIDAINDLTESKIRTIIKRKNGIIIKKDSLIYDGEGFLIQRSTTSFEDTDVDGVISYIWRDNQLVEQINDLEDPSLSGNIKYDYDTEGHFTTIARRIGSQIYNDDYIYNEDGTLSHYFVEGKRKTVTRKGDTLVLRTFVDNSGAENLSSEIYTVTNELDEYRVEKKFDALEPNRLLQETEYLINYSMFKIADEILLNSGANPVSNAIETEYWPLVTVGNGYICNYSYEQDKYGRLIKIIPCETVVEQVGETEYIY